MKVLADGRECRLTYIGEPEHDGVVQVNVELPEGIRTGMVPVDMLRADATGCGAGDPICATGWVRIMTPGPTVPRLSTIPDGINLLSRTRIVTGTVKVMMTEVTYPETFHATIDGRDALEIDSFCVDPTTRRYEFNFKVPPGIR